MGAGFIYAIRALCRARLHPLVNIEEVKQAQTMHQFDHAAIAPMMGCTSGACLHPAHVQLARARLVVLRGRVR